MTSENAKLDAESSEVNEYKHFFDHGTCHLLPQTRDPEDPAWVQWRADHPNDWQYRRRKVDGINSDGGRVYQGRPGPWLNPDGTKHRGLLAEESSQKPKTKPKLRLVEDVEATDNATLDQIAAEQDSRDELTGAKDDLADMNAKFAVVKIGGKTRVVSMEPSPADPAFTVPVFSTIHDFTAFYANPKKLVPTPDGRDRKIGIGKWWIDHEQRRQLDGIVYIPNEDTPGKLNLWQGYGCEPEVGDCGLYLDHTHKIICAGNDEHFAYLLGWMANAVQRPGEPGEVAIVLRGREGTGKGVFAKHLGALFGGHFRHIHHAKHLTGHFNAHLQNCSLLFADESFFAGDRSHESVLKGLITEETLLVEPKGVDSYQVRNCIHLIMASNSEWVVPAGADARRYFVLDVADSHKQDDGYFGKLVHQMDNGGREALLHYLQSIDLSEIGFNLRKVPQTSALADQKSRSLRGVDRLVETIAHEGRLPGSDAMYPNVAITTGEARGDGFYVEVRKLVPDLRHETSLVINRTLSKEWGCEHWHSRHRNGIKFPPLAELRQKFDAKFGSQTWPPEVTEWDAPAALEDFAK